MTRELLLEKICLSDCTYNCVILDSCDCDYCNVKLSELLDEYDKHVIEQYKADTNLKDTIREIHDSVANEMYCKGIDDMFNEINTCRTYDEYVDGANIYRTYDEYVNVLDVLEIAKRLKAGVKNE